MKSLLTVTRLRGVEKQLTRIADGIEAYLRIAHNYNLTAPKAVPSDGDESIEYSDDEKTTILEVKDLLTRNRIQEVEDD